MEIKIEEMRGCVIGPCRNEEKQKIKELLLEAGEVVEPNTLWTCFQEDYNSVKYFDEDEDWGTTDHEPNISFSNFVKTYFEPEPVEPERVGFFKKLYEWFFKRKSE
jgi:hypothetical protein